MTDKKLELKDLLPEVYKKTIDYYNTMWVNDREVDFEWRYNWHTSQMFNLNKQHNPPLIEKVRSMLTWCVVNAKHDDSPERLVYLDQDDTPYVLSGLPEGWSLSTVQSTVYDRKVVLVTPPTPDDQHWCELAHEYLMRRGFMCSDVQSEWGYDADGQCVDLNCYNFEVIGMRYNSEYAYWVDNAYVNPSLPNTIDGGYDAVYYCGDVTTDYGDETLCGDCATLAISAYGQDMIGGFEYGVVFVSSTDGYDAEYDVTCEHCNKLILKGTETIAHEQATLPLAPKMLIIPDLQGQWVLDENDNLVELSDYHRWFLTALNEDGTTNTNRKTMTVEILAGERNEVFDQIARHVNGVYAATNYNMDAATHAAIYFLNTNNNKVVKNEFFLEFEKIIAALEPWDSDNDQPQTWVNDADVRDECNEKGLPVPEEYQVFSY